MNCKIFILIIFLFPSCINENKTNKFSSNEGNVIQTFKKLSPNTDFSTQNIILIIPFDGCSSCFDKAVSLIPTIKKNKGLVVIPSLQKRRVSNFIEENGFELKNIIPDTLQLTIKEGIIDLNPKIYIINENKIIFYSLVDELDILTFQSKYLKY